MTWPSDSELDNLVEHFCASSLPKKEWTHAAHLAAGAWFVWQVGAETALGELRARIRALNNAHGTPNTAESGYHESITRAYITLIAEFRSGHPELTSPGECARALLESPIAARDALMAFYSRDLLMSAAARLNWVPPDLADLRAE